jgi:hypothetical protein
MSNQTISAYRSSDNTSINSDFSLWTLTGGPSSFNGVVLGGIFMFLSSVDSALSISWKVTRDIAGDEPITPVHTVDIVTGQTTATDGGVTAALGIPLSRMSGWTGTDLYLWVRSNSTASTAETITPGGTATGVSAHISYVANTY